MQKKTSGFLRIINRILYYGSAALMITSLALGVAFQPVQAVPASSDYGQLQISDIQCYNNQVGIQFILNNVTSGWTPDSTITFKLVVDGGSPTTQTATFTSQTGGAYHYFYYGNVNGTYDVTSAYTFVRLNSSSQEIDLHNPDAYSTTDQNCSDVTPTDVTPTDVTPTDVTPTDVTPTDVTPTDVTPTDVTPTDVTPTDVTPTDVTPTDVTPTDVTPTDVTPTDVTPTDVTPTDVTPTDVTPTDVTPTDVTPTDVTPTDVTPTDVTPTDVTPSNTPRNPTPLPPLKLALIDPYCNPNGTVQWTVENPGSTNVTVLYWWLDGSGHQPGFTAAPGSTKFTTITVGTHTVHVVYGESQLVSLTYTIDSCSVHIVTLVPPTITPIPTPAPLPIPNTGGGGLLIPVTGADQTPNLGVGLLLSGMSLLGIAIVLSKLRKKYSL